MTTSRVAQAGLLFVIAIQIISVLAQTPTLPAGAETAAPAGGLIAADRRGDRTQVDR
jgi:hypothetical protein